MRSVGGALDWLLPEAQADSEEWVYDRWHRALRIRYVGIALVAVVGALLFGWWLGPLIGLAVGGYNRVQEIWLRRRRVPSWWLPTGDALIAVAFIAIEPRALVPAALVMVTSVAFATSIGPTWKLGASGPAVAAMVAGTLGLVGLGLAERVESAPLTATGYAVSSIMVMLGLGGLVDSEARLRRRLSDLVDQLDAVVWTRCPLTHRFTYVSGQAASLLGYSTAEWQSAGFWVARLHPEDRERVLEAVAAGQAHDLAYRMVDADGSTVHVLDRVRANPDGGSSSELHGVTLDVTERRSLEQRSQQYSDIVEHIDLPLLVSEVEPGPDGPRLAIQFVNPAARRLIGDHPVPGSGLGDVLLALSDPGVMGRLLTVKRTGEAMRLADLDLGPSGGGRQAVIDAFRLPGDLVAVSLQDTTEVARVTRALRRQALHDGLTGLPNRAQLEEVVRQEVAEVADTGGRVALLLMDLDQFKEVNDSLGHSVGDRLLIAIADRLRRLLGATAFVARLGGDEFAVVMSGRHVDELAARGAAEVVASSLSAAFTLDDIRLQTNVSIGIALVPDHAPDADELVRRADVAMYVAKRSGSGAEVYRPEEDSSSVARLTLISDLRDAVDDGQLILHYQPVMDLRRNTLIGTEALVRWQHPTLGLLMPDDFISLAALSGATRSLAHWVIGEATRAAARWQAEGHAVGVSVNLSVRNLFDRDLLSVTEAALVESGLEPSDLVVELTETELMEDPSVALARFEAFQTLGVRTSVDDFGTGYSSLTYLRDLPLSEIKVDRSFVQAMHLRGGAFTIVRSMIDLGHNLGLEVVAEGVEHADDVPTLVRLGCDRAQGFHFARPMPEAELLTWMAERSDERIAAQHLA